LRHFNGIRTSGTTYRMRLRHAAALALVGWYLMLPPVNQDTASVDSKAAVVHWTKLDGKYETEKACAKALSDHNPLIEAIDGSGYARAKKVQAELVSDAQCIDENDPRFKGWKGDFIGRIR
jgi:hypothetical protein